VMKIEFVFWVMTLCNLVSGGRSEAFLVDTVNEIFLGYQPLQITDIAGTTSAPIIGLRCYYTSKLSYLYINLQPMTKTMCMPMEGYLVKSRVCLRIGVSLYCLII
jgi:hypothetical protein